MRLDFYRSMREVLSSAWARKQDHITLADTRKRILRARQSQTELF